MREQVVGPVEVRLGFHQIGTGLRDPGLRLQVGRLGGVGVRAVNGHQGLTPFHGIAQPHQHAGYASGNRQHHAGYTIRIDLDFAR